MQNAVFLDSFKSLRANAAPLPYPERFSALETKAVDGQENPFNTILSAKFYEVQPYLTVTHPVYSPWIVLVSSRYWDGLSKDERTVLQKAALISRNFERTETREEAARALVDLKACGMQINELSAAEVGRRRDRLTHINASVAANVGMDLWNDTQADFARICGKK